MVRYADVIDAVLEQLGAPGRYPAPATAGGAATTTDAALWPGDR
jgi:hypothetical protein